MIQLLNNLKTEKYVKLKNLILSPEFSWYWNENSTYNTNNQDDHENFGFYSHAFLQRPDDTDKCYSKPNSHHLDAVYDVLYEILISNQIQPQVFYRICANSVHPTRNNLPCTPHYDHSFPHKNLLIYLTDVNNGETVVENEKYYGKEDNVIIFEGKHYHKPPTKDRRIVLISTFI